MNKWIVTRWKDYFLWALCENNRVLEFQFEPIEASASIGDIYIGKVKNVATNINAAFVDIGKGEPCYLPGAEGLKAGQEFPVQIVKEAIKTKAPVVTRELSLSGSICVLVFKSQGIHFSHKITDTVWKQEMEEKLSSYKSREYSLVLRTHAYDEDPAVIEAEIQVQIARWKQLRETLPYRTCFSRVWQAGRDWLSVPVEEIVTDEPVLVEQLKEEVFGIPLRLYEDRLLPLKKLYSLETWLTRAVQKQVWLKSGGYLVIEPTEALTVIDVNTGKYEGKKSKEETFFKINLEAAVEIAAQLRLRNLSGMILVDFINMKRAEEKERVLFLLAQEVKKDRVKACVVDMTKLGLVELTRKREHRPVYEIL